MSATAAKSKNYFESLTEYGESALDNGWVPDAVLRPVVRKLNQVRLNEINKGNNAANLAAKLELIDKLSAPSRPLAEHQDKANQQHYEVPTAFLKLCLGPRMKYSSCYYPSLEVPSNPGASKDIKYAKESLGEAEEIMLRQYCDKAGLPRDDPNQGKGLTVLDLGCGWGSLGLYLAEHYPQATIKMLSNSKTQKLFIDDTCKSKGFNNVEVITGDFTVFDFEKKEQFTHVMSIEMFEHMKGYPTLFAKVATWLKPQGKMFIQVFVHKDTPYEFEDDDGWMSKHFFSGGTMPSLDLFNYFQDDLKQEHVWFIPGTHYAQTLETWLKLQDSNSKECIKLLEADAEAKGYGRDEGRKSFYRFRVFFLACGEFFATDRGETWGLGHYLFSKR